MSTELSAIPFILMYHSISPYTEDPYRVTVSPERFDQQMRALYRRGLRGIAVRQLLASPFAAPTNNLVGLTFDDGFTDFITHAMPILHRYRFTATVFVIAERLGGYNEWNVPGPRKALMTADDVRQIARSGIEVGSHGLRHVSLKHLNYTSLVHEVRHSREFLEDTLGHPVSGFCYPYGDVDSRAIESVQAAGYDYGCAIWPSALTCIHGLPRTYINDRDGPLRLRVKHLHHRVPLGRRRDRGPRRLAGRFREQLLMRVSPINRFR